MFVWSRAEAVMLPIVLLLILVLTLVITVLLKDKKFFVRKMPLIAITVIMITLELIKQYLMLGDYNAWALPLHFCSTFMVWFSIASFTKGTIQEIGFTISVASSFLFFLLFYIDPTSIIGNSSSAIFSSFSNFHTFLYHHLIILFLFLSITLKMYKPRFNHLYCLTLFFSLYTIIAIYTAHKLNTNFASLLYNNIEILQKMLDRYGYFIYTGAMYLFALLSMVLITVLGIKVNKKNHSSLMNDFENMLSDNLTASPTGDSALRKQ